eukprot:TRINITY_DN5152_c0_g1_i20.p1 TRINITY_DN5152_c0_g1~~TRINITY_DN5152_c0_g1_i20.p1  ORF type:complete len:554 (-),score=186.14 TRINITY_DN5152_c0_g1_i20:834-2495(-)
MDPGLDYASLMGLAEHVSKDKPHGRPMFLKTKFDGPKKEKKDKGKLNANVRKFLEKKEAEEKAKEEERKTKLKNLQELRSESSKNKIAKHLKVTKSANKAVIDEAVNKRDTADTMTGRKQCDEDDYGFTSSTSSSLYEKLMGKYESCPDDPMAKFSKAKVKTAVDIDRAKERVKQALRQEEEPQPRKRKRKGGGEVNNDDDDSNISYTRVRDEKELSRLDDSKGFSSSSKEDKSRSQKQRDKEEAAKKRKEMAKKAPKPMDFTSLLQMANVVKDRPVVVQKKKDVKEFDLGDRPMTKKQREEYIRENESRLRKEGKLPPKEVPKIPKLNASSTSNADNNNHKTSHEKTKSGTPPLKSGSSTPSDKPAVSSSASKQSTTAAVRRPEPGPSLHPAVLKSMKKESSSSHHGKMNSGGRDSGRSSGGETADRRDFDKRKNGGGGGSSSSSGESGRLKEEKRRIEEKFREKEEENKRLMEQMKQIQAKLEANSKSASHRESSNNHSSKNGRSEGKKSIQEVESRRFPGEKVAKKKEKSKSSNRMRIESDEEIHPRGRE